MRSVDRIRRSRTPSRTIRELPKGAGTYHHFSFVSQMTPLLWQSSSRQSYRDLPSRYHPALGAAYNQPGYMLIRQDGNIHVLEVIFTFIKGAIHWKVNLLKKPAVYSLETCRSLGTGGIDPHLSGLGVLYHGLGTGKVALEVVRVAALVSVA